jgi:hypothetical protein
VAVPTEVIQEEITSESHLSTSETSTFCVDILTGSLTNATHSELIESDEGRIDECKVSDSSQVSREFSEFPITMEQPSTDFESLFLNGETMNLRRNETVEVGDFAVSTEIETSQSAPTGISEIPANVEIGDDSTVKVETEESALTIVSNVFIDELTEGTRNQSLTSPHSSTTTFQQFTIDLTPRRRRMRRKKVKPGDRVAIAVQTEMPSNGIDGILVLDCVEAAEEAIEIPEGPIVEVAEEEAIGEVVAEEEPPAEGAKEDRIGEVAEEEEPLAKSVEEVADEAGDPLRRRIIFRPGSLMYDRIFRRTLINVIMS